MTRRSLVSAALLCVLGLSGSVASAATSRAPFPGHALSPDHAQDHDRYSPWATAWSTAMEPPAASGQSVTGFSDQTIRLVVHTTAAGDRVRIRLSNVFGAGPLDIGAADIAVRASATSADAVPGSDRPLTFAGSATATVPDGAEAVSDPVSMHVAADTDLLVSIYLPTATGPTTWHGWARQTSYLSAAGSGDAAGQASGAAFGTPVTSWFFLRSVEVAGRGPDATAGTLAVIGDSITEGWKAPIDSDQRWTDDLARRLQSRPADRRLGIANEGIGGGRVLSDGPNDASHGTITYGPSAVARFPRDVLQFPDLRGVVIYEGINDLSGLFGVHPGQQLTADQLIAGFSSIAAQAHAAGVPIYAATITPKGGLSPTAEAIRQQVNTWLRTGHAFDAVFDFDAALRDPADPAQINPVYDSGDHLHPNAAGLQLLADTVDLDRLPGN